MESKVKQIAKKIAEGIAAPRLPLRRKPILEGKSTRHVWTIGADPISANFACTILQNLTGAA